MKKLYPIIALVCMAFPAHAQFTADFENANLDGWTQVPSGRWAASTTTPLAGRYSLKHTFDNPTAATDIIYCPLSGVMPNSGTTRWRFLLRHGYNPSSTNRWAFFLFSNAAGSEWKSSGAYEGYAIGVNMVGSDDTLALYAVRNNTFTIVRKTTINWEQDIRATGKGVVEVLRSNEGGWNIRGNTAGDTNALQTIAVPVTHTTYSTANYSGILYQYTASADMLLWADNISISFTRVYVPTKINTASLQGHSSIALTFTQAVDSATAVVAENYKLYAANDSLTPVAVEILDPTKVSVTFANPVPRGNATIKVTGISDENRLIINDVKELSIFYLLYGDVVINELMVAPAPAVGLPEVGYIELYNRLDIPVPLNGWKMEYNATVGNIGTATIPAHGYLILCSSAALDVMRDYGNATSVSYISSLTKAGKTLSLKNADGLLLSRVTYSDKWIADEAKRSGGWSLEKIDIDNLSETLSNWAVSTDERGGTPGQQNAVHAANPDTKPPAIAAFKQLDSQTLQITFNELFDTTKAKTPLCYLLDNGMGNPQEVTWSRTNPEQITLHFLQPFAEGTLYTLTVDAPFCDLAGNIPNDLVHTFGNLSAPQTGEIIINEVLFNPYPNGTDFVEIYNRSDKIFDLQQLKLANRDKNGNIASAYSVAQQHFLYPNDYAVFTTNKEAVQQFYTVPSPGKILVLSGFPSYPDDKGNVVLISGKDVVLDELVYSEKMHSPFLATAKGVSLERVNAGEPSNMLPNWQSARQAAGFATPTGRNSQTNRINIYAAVLQGTNSIEVSFTQAVDERLVQAVNNYKLCYANDTLIPVQVEILQSTKVLVNFGKQLPRGVATIAAAGIINCNSLFVDDTAPVSIFYLFYGDVVINELMAASAPAVGLPEVSYIELYNRLDIPVTLNGWKMEYSPLSGGSATAGNISSATIPAHGYLMLCSSAVLDTMRHYGNATSVSYISNLTKSGKTLALKTSDGTLLSRVGYSDKWITNEAKCSGGWSLEKIDSNNLSETAANWVASTDERGGTPGQRNSVCAHNPDMESPVLAVFKQINNQTLVLAFNELFDTTKAKNPLCYMLSNGIGKPQEVTWNRINPEQVTLHFAKPFTEGILYNLAVDAPFCDLAGNIPDNLVYTFGNLSTPQAGEIIINEVLFNPYANGVDFVEIYNRSGKIFDLQYLKLTNRDKNNKVASVHSVAQQYFLYPNDYAAFTTNVDAVRQFYSVPSPEKMIVLSGFPSYPDDAGCVVLLASDDSIADEFCYSAEMHSGFLANAEGISLERVNPERPSNEHANWQSAAQDAGFATPTYRNSQFNTNEETTASAFSLPYDVFSPDGDSYNDVLYIDYDLSAPGYVATISIYDANGRPVKELEKKILLGSAGRFAWDGTRYDNHIATPGMYIVYIELYDVNGNIQRIKKSCALAMRR